METDRVRDDEVAVVQYLRPDGRKRVVFAPVGIGYVSKAEGMVLSAEVLTTGFVAMYGRYENEPEEAELIELSPNDGEEPTKLLRTLIDRVIERRSKALKINEVEADSDASA